MRIDIIGDIHGCYDELLALIKKLGYRNEQDMWIHPEKRKLAFVGDLTDRGPNSIEVIMLVSKLVKNHLAYYVPGNHCNKLYRYFLGRNVQQTHGLETTVAELNALSDKKFQHVRSEFMKLYENAPLYAVLDEKKLIIAHAGIRKDYIGRNDKRVETFVLYGDITGEKHPDGSPVRRDWAQKYDGDAWIVYGHTPVEKPRFVNRTVNIDTGCVFGGHLTALRYPEMETISVPSSMPYVSENFRAFPHTSK